MIAFLTTHPVTFAVLASIAILGTIAACMLVWFGIDERNRRKAYATRESFDSLRYMRISDTMPDREIPSLVQPTCNFKKG